MVSPKARAGARKIEPKDARRAKGTRLSKWRPNAWSERKGCSRGRAGTDTALYAKRNHDRE